RRGCCAGHGSVRPERRSPETASASRIAMSCCPRPCLCCARRREWRTMILPATVLPLCCYDDSMDKKRWTHPLDLKTGRLRFTPMLRETGERLHLEVDYHSFPLSRESGYHGDVQDLLTGRWYAIFGKECDIPGCHCDAWVEEIAVPPIP